MLKLIPALYTASGAVIFPQHATNGHSHGADGFGLLDSAIANKVLGNPRKLSFKVGTAITRALVHDLLHGARELG